MQTATFSNQDELQRADVLRLGLWMFLSTVAMLFAAFASAYLVRRASSDWAQVELPSTFGLNTLVLSAASAVLEAARGWGMTRRWRASSAGLGGAVGLTIGFLGGQVVAWQQLMSQGIFLPDTPHASFLYVLTGAHGVHVAAALLLLTVTTVRTWTGLGRRRFARWAVLMDTTRTFCHFLLAVWLGVLFLLSNY